MSDPLRIAAPAKLNLFLQVTGRRPDNYHLLESLVAFTDFGDTLEIRPADDISLTVEGPFSAPLQDSGQNLVMQAAELLRAEAGVKDGAQIVLSKHIPIAAGLGGGSADAAAALRGLRALWNIAIDNEDLHRLALTLGSDVPACLLSQPLWLQGTGDEVTPVPMHAEAWAVLVNPGLPLATADVFGRFSGVFAAASDAPEAIDSLDDLAMLIQLRQNALTPAAAALMPAINDVLAAIRNSSGCLLARMSGSGATCFGLYASEASARMAAETIHGKHPGWWCVSTGFHEAQ
ncbi:MAG: 4-(cytidine 5'-diphospho)-2-C-methyl-D-erythritol kinase [Pseudomonadota bacterium]|nr:4-(cytidine 5'-diphospho)-2-C-methyl-D-erythritol kinase [Pseudomonadota bacterium]